MAEVRELIDVVKKVTGEQRAKALGALQNLAANDDNKVTLALPALGLLPLLVEVVREDKSEARVNAFGVLGNLLGYIPRPVFTVFNLHVKSLSLLRDAGPDRSLWDAGVKDLIPDCLGFLMNVASHDDASDDLKAAGALEVVSPIFSIETNGCVGLKALFIIAFLIGKDEATKTQSALLTDRPGFVNM